MLRIFRYSSLAAAIMLLLVGIAFVMQSSRNTVLAFEQAKEKARTAKSVSYELVRIDASGNGIEEKHFVKGDLHRIEVWDFKQEGAERVYKERRALEIYIANYQSGEQLNIHEKVREAERSKISKSNFQTRDGRKIPRNPMEQFLTITQNDVERIGEEKIKGRAAHVYNANKMFPDMKAHQIAEVWIDVETGFVVQMLYQAEIHSPVAPKKLALVTIENFKWNEPLDEKLFSFDVPKDYRLVSSNPNATEESFTIFGRVIENAKKAKSVSYVSVIETKGSGTKEKHFIQGDLHRRESSPFYSFPGNKDKDPQPAGIDILITSYKTRESIQIDETAKTVKKWVGSKDWKEKSPMDLMLEFTSKEVERIGEETIDGKKLHVYNAKKIITPKPGENQFATNVAKVWIDAETGYMVRVHIEIITGDSANSLVTSVKVDNFKWNEPLDEKLFSFDVPKGYKLLAVDAPKKNDNTIEVFGQVIENVKKAKSVSYVCVFESLVDNFEEKHFVQGDLHRRELRKFSVDFWTQKRDYYLGAPDTFICNYETKENIQLDEKERTAKKWISSKDVKMKNPIEEMLAPGSSDIERIGEETINGRKAYLYNAKEKSKIESSEYQFTAKSVKIWIDAETSYPIRYNCEFASKEGFGFKLKLDNFKWNEPLDEKLFSFDVPKDYKLLAVDPPKNDNTIAIFGQVIENVKKATSLTFTMNQVIGGGQELPFEIGKVAQKYSCRGDLVRCETYQTIEKMKIKDKLSGIYITNFKTNESLDLDVTKQIAKQKKGGDSEERATNLIEQFTRLKSSDAEFVREEKIDGKIAKLYRVNGKDFIGGIPGFMNVWVDPTSELPVKIVFDIRSPNNDPQEEFNINFQDFQWNVPLEDKLFSFDIPADYKLAKEEASAKLPVENLLAKVNENVKSATSMSFTQNLLIAQGQEIVMKFTAAGDWVRMDIEGDVQGTRGNITNNKTGEQLGLATIGDRNFALRGVKTPTVDATTDVVGYFASLAKSKDAKFIGEEKVFGKTLHLYYATLPDQGGGIECQVWIDPVNHLPARLVYKSMSEATEENGNKRKIATSNICENFKWNFPVKNEFFTKPAGYTVVDQNDEKAVEEMNAAAEKAKQKDSNPKK